MNSGEVGKNDVLVFIGDHRRVSYTHSLVFLYNIARIELVEITRVLIFTKI